MPRPSNTNVRRAQIVKGLQAAMAKHGYDGASIQTIAKEARLTPGLIHYHFATKQEILVELIGHLTQNAESRIGDFAEKDATPLQRLNSLIDAYLAPGKGASPQSVAAWVAIAAEAIKQKEVRQVYQTAIARRHEEVTALLDEVLHSSGKSTKNSSKLAAGLLSLMEGAFQLASAAPDILPKGYAADMAKMMIQGFIAESPSARSK